jgi:hypothetical protein
MHKRLITLTPSLKIASERPALARISPPVKLSQAQSRLIKVNRAATASESRSIGVRERNQGTKLLVSATLPLDPDLVPFSETYGKPRKATERYGRVRKLLRITDYASPKPNLLQKFTAIYGYLRLKYSHALGGARPLPSFPVPTCRGRDSSGSQSFPPASRQRISGNGQHPRFRKGTETHGRVRKRTERYGKVRNHRKPPVWELGPSLGNWVFGYSRITNYACITHKPLFTMPAAVVGFAKPKSVVLSLIQSCAAKSRKL